MTEITGDITGLGVNLDPNVDLRVPKQSLEQDDFLQLIITEMTNQGISSTTDTSELLQNFVTLGNFDAMQNMAGSVDNINENVSFFFSQQQMILAQALLGENVEIPSTEVGQPNIVGEVTSYRISNGEVFITVDGAEYSSAQVIEIKNKPAPEVPAP